MDQVRSHIERVRWLPCRGRTTRLTVSRALLVCVLLLPGPGHAETPQRGGKTPHPVPNRRFTDGDSALGPQNLLAPLSPGSTPQDGNAPADTVGHATLRTWEEELWLTLLDRKDSFGGQLSDRGTLKRFTDLIDSKHLLDLLGSRFSPMESYRWYQRDAGFRWRAVSATALDLAAFAELKAKVPLGGPWNMGVRVDQISGPRFDGSAVRIRLSRDLGETGAAFAGLHLDPHKSGGDIWVGGQWNPGPAKLTAQFTVFDFLNNLLFVTRDAAAQTRKDTTVVYERQPTALRTSGEVALSDELRLEAYGSVVFPSSVVVHQRDDRAMGFTLDESVWYAGTMLEWTPSPRLLVAGSVTSVRARSKRTPNSLAASVEGYELVERSTEAEAFLAFRPSERWTISGTAVRMWLPERRSVTEDPSKDVDYLLNAWLTKLDLAFTARGGFLSRLSLLTSDTSVPRGLGSMDVNYGTLENEFYRFLLDLGWSFENARIVVGGAYDYHPRDTTGWIWGTVSSRLILTW